jgi:acetyl-CoA carboxylase carboxyl transferase subunit alpha
LLKAGIIDEIIPEPTGGAHADPAAATALVDGVLERTLRDVSALDNEARLVRRYDKFRNMGRMGIDFIDDRP